MIEKIISGEVKEYSYTTPTEVDTLVNFINKFELHDRIKAFRFLEDTAECDFQFDDCVISASCLKGYRYNHSLTFSRGI